MKFVLSICVSGGERVSGARAVRRAAKVRPEIRLRFHRTLAFVDLLITIDF